MILIRHNPTGKQDFPVLRNTFQVSQLFWRAIGLAGRLSSSLPDASAATAAPTAQKSTLIEYPLKAGQIRGY
jgi:hypothetical protein